MFNQLCYAQYDDIIMIFVQQYIVINLFLRYEIYKDFVRHGHDIKPFIITQTDIVQSDCSISGP